MDQNKIFPSGTWWSKSLGQSRISALKASGISFKDTLEFKFDGVPVDLTYCYLIDEHLGEIPNPSHILKLLAPTNSQNQDDTADRDMLRHYCELLVRKSSHHVDFSFRVRRLLNDLQDHFEAIEGILKVGDGPRSLDIRAFIRGQKVWAQKAGLVKASTAKAGENDERLKNVHIVLLCICFLRSQILAPEAAASWQPYPIESATAGITMHSLCLNFWLWLSEFRFEMNLLNPFSDRHQTVLVRRPQVAYPDSEESPLAIFLPTEESAGRSLAEHCHTFHNVTQRVGLHTFLGIRKRAFGTYLLGATHESLQDVFRVLALALEKR